MHRTVWKRRVIVDLVSEKIKKYETKANVAYILALPQIFGTLAFRLNVCKTDNTWVQ